MQQLLIELLGCTACCSLVSSVSGGGGDAVNARSNNNNDIKIPSSHNNKEQLANPLLSSNSDKEYVKVVVESEGEAADGINDHRDHRTSSSVFESEKRPRSSAQRSGTGDRDSYAYAEEEEADGVGSRTWSFNDPRSEDQLLSVIFNDLN